MFANQGDVYQRHQHGLRGHDENYRRRGDAGDFLHAGKEGRHQADVPEKDGLHVHAVCQVNVTLHTSAGPSMIVPVCMYVCMYVCMHQPTIRAL